MRRRPRRLAAAGAGTAAPAAAASRAANAVRPAANGSVDVAKLMEPGPLPDVVVGKADAPVTIVEYASMTCPHCAAFAINTLPEIKKTYIDTGKAKLILREFPFDPRAVAAFMLARCAPGDRREAMVDVLFEQQDELGACRQRLGGAARHRQARRLHAGELHRLPQRQGPAGQGRRHAAARRRTSSA